MSHDPKKQSEPDELIFDCELTEPPEQVWRALTDSALLAAWLMPNDFRPELGATFSFQPDDAQQEPPIECQVLTIDPPHLLRYSWRDAEQEASEAPPSVVTFVLRPTAPGGTHLRLVHSERAQPGRLGQLLVLPLGANSAPRMRCAA